MQYDVFTALEDLGAYGDDSTLHDIAGRLYENDTRLVGNALRWLKSVGLVEERGGAFRLVEGAELERPRKRAGAAAPAPPPKRAKTAPARKPAAKPARKPAAAKPAAKPATRRTAASKAPEEEEESEVVEDESFGDGFRAAGASALVRRRALPADQGLKLAPCFSSVLRADLRWAQPPTFPKLFVGDVVEPVEDRGIRCKITKVGRKLYHVDFGDGSRLETFEAHQLRLIKGLTNVYRDEPTLSRSRRDALTTLARTQFKPMVYEKGDDGKYKAEELPFAMNSPEAARRTPSKSYDLNGRNDICLAWLRGGLEAMAYCQPPLNMSLPVPDWHRGAAQMSPLAVMALAAADGSFSASPQKPNTLGQNFRIRMKTTAANIQLCLCVKHRVGAGSVFIEGSGHMTYYSYVVFRCANIIMMQFLGTYWRCGVTRAPQFQLAIAVLQEAGLSRGSTNCTPTDAEVEARQIIAHALSTANHGKDKAQKKDAANIRYYAGLFGGLDEAQFLEFVAFFVLGDGTAGIYSNGKNPPRYCISVKQSDESFLEALSDCLRKHGFAKLSIGEGGLDGFADDGYDRRKAYNGSIASVEACRELAEGLLVSLRAAGLQMSRKVKALELMVANATPTQSVLDAYRAS